VAELCAIAGFAPDPQQELGLDMIFAVGRERAAGVASRSARLLPAEPEDRAVQAGRDRLAVRHRRAQGRLVGAPDRHDPRRAARPRAAADREPGAGEAAAEDEEPRDLHRQQLERIELATGQQIKFKARTNGGGRGLTGDKVILDEAFALKPAHVGSLIPTMTAGRTARCSTARRPARPTLRPARRPRPRAPGARRGCPTWSGWRRARSAPDPDCTHPKDAAPRGLDCALDREDLWRAANPTITTGRISLQTIADLRQELPPEEFMRESLGWWEDGDDGAGAVFGPAAGRRAPASWRCPSSRPPSVWPSRSTGPGRRSRALGGRDDRRPGGPGGRAGRPVFVAAVDRREDVGWLVDEVKRIQDEHDCAVVIDEKGPTADLLDDFEDADVAVETVTSTSTPRPAAGSSTRSAPASWRTPPAELDEACPARCGAGSATGACGAASQVSETDVSMLEAATLAAYGAEKFGGGVQRLLTDQQAAGAGIIEIVGPVPGRGRLRRPRGRRGALVSTGARRARRRPCS
jgi:hypothetical protein